MAKFYKDEPQISVYEIWNEPYPADCSTALKDDPEWIKGIRKFYTDAVKAILEIDQKHIIMASDYNAGWGRAWEICWKDYCKDLDEYNNTCFSIHVGHEQLDYNYADYSDWMIRMAAENNACLYMGEIETEPGIETVKGIENLVELITKTADTHHFPAVLWRPHGDEVNYVKYWHDAVAVYTDGTIDFD